MVNYSKGLTTKNLILDTAKKLFYEKGYIDATFDEIWKTAEVNPGTIAYHFGSKNNIASIIYTEIMDNLYTYCCVYAENETQEFRMMLRLAFHYYLFYNNAHYRTFSCQFTRENNYSGIDDNALYREHAKEGYENLLQHYTPAIAEFIFAVSTGLGAAIETYLSVNIKNLTFYDILNYSSMYFFMYLTDDERRTSNERTMKIIKTLEISCDFFDIKIAKKNK